jgi:Zn-dependent protease with chaperone function
VRRSLLILAVNLARAGVATWYNPAWWFVRGYWKLFLVISQGASRLQEVLADRWAAMAYGSEDFVRGLTHVIERSVRFDAHVNATLNEVVPKRLPLGNIYSFRPSEAPPPDDVAKATELALGARPTAYDSHPCPEDRIAWVRALASGGRPRAPEDELPAWGLFEQREVIEGRMTSKVRERVRAARGVEIPAEASASAE